MTSGNSRPDSTTMNSEMPSMPTCQEMPSEAIHSRFVTNWNPSSARSNAARA
jgi:hypothetical protein